MPGARAGARMIRDKERPRGRHKLIEVGFWAPLKDSRRERHVFGVFAELARAAGLAPEPYPDVQTCVDTLWAIRTPGEYNAVLGHLLKGRRIMAYMGHSPCRFCGKDNGCAEYSDGTYVWPEGFAHYLTEHGVKPPEKFVRHCTGRSAR